MNQEFVEFVRDYAESNGYRLRTDYSGRGMCGHTCIGVTTDDPAGFLADILMEAVDALGVGKAKAKKVLVTGCKKDQMGLDYIVYWPSLQVEA